MRLVVLLDIELTERTRRRDTGGGRFGSEADDTVREDGKEKRERATRTPSDESESQAQLRAELERVRNELAEREQDLQVYRSELERVNHTLEELIDQASADLKISHSLQKLLVPTEFPNIPGFEFSTRFVASQLSGGDYFDIFELEDRMKFGILLASASGYGMSSLLLSVLLKFTGHEEARSGVEPHVFVEFVRSELIRLGAKPTDRAALFYGIVDRRDLGFKYASAGRFHGGLLRNASLELEMFQEGIEELTGAASSSAQPTQSPSPSPRSEQQLSAVPLHGLVLEARDRLVVASQGITQVQSPDASSFGEARLIGLLKKVLREPDARVGTSDVHLVRNEILYQAEKFAAGIPYPRDLTVVVAEVKDRVIRLAGRRKSET